MSTNTDSYEVDPRVSHRLGEEMDARHKYPPGWTEEDVERLVGRVSQRVMDNFYQEVGRSLFKRALSALGLGVIGAMIWLAGIKAKLWGGT
jgi:hypothetical protein